MEKQLPAMLPPMASNTNEDVAVSDAVVTGLEIKKKVAGATDAANNGIEQ